MPGKAEVSSEESRSLLGGKSEFPPRKVRPGEPVPSSRSRVPQTLVNNVDFVRQKGTPFLCGEGREIGNFEHQGPHFKPSGARLDVREILLRELHSAETLRCWIGL